MEEHRDLWWPSPTGELGKTVRLGLPEPFTCDHEGEIPEIQVSYETWGELNEARDNVVLIVHPMTADCHVTGLWAEQPQGWWEDLVGPGRGIDTDRYHVVCPNLIGGCYGTTGPRFPSPDGDPWYERFPLLTPRDMMRVQRLFLQAIGIERVALVVGPSMGGMVAWEWAIEAADIVDTVVVVAAPLVATAHQIAMNWLQRRGIELDMVGNEFAARTGQMIARGVGMLSYRNPVGLEEKFGREWFKKPGKTLGERGMYNVESWLRFHGKRIVKRFDPYTYLLYSRAMDLHDVREGRGDLVAALDRVDCDVLVLGITGDHLYPPEEVHAGADLLRHLGKDVHYEEIRSLDGHDAVFLETEQIARTMTDHRARRERHVPSVAERSLRVVRVGILGAGRVATSFRRLLDERREDLAENHGLAIEVCALADTDPDRVVDPLFEGVPFHHDPSAIAGREDLDVLLELTRGMTGRWAVEEALRRRRPVVTPNKPLIHEHGADLERLAFEHGVRIAYHDSIAAGWPLLYSVERTLASGEIVTIRAMLTTTCNHVLDRITAGDSLAGAVEDAVARDITEPDPHLDLSGWDAAQKLSILVTRALRRRHWLAEEAILGIEELDPELIRGVVSLGLRVRLVAYARLENGVPSGTVRPMAVPAGSHLGTVRGQNHVVVMETRTEGELVQAGPGLGTLPAATAVLNDLIGVLDPEHSWTGRFPVAAEAMTAPAFDLFVGMDEGKPVLGQEETAGAIPLLAP